MPELTGFDMRIPEYGLIRCGCFEKIHVSNGGVMSQTKNVSSISSNAVHVNGKSTAAKRPRTDPEFYHGYRIELVDWSMEDCTVQITPSINGKHGDRPDSIWSGPCETLEEAIWWAFAHARASIDASLRRRTA